MARRLDELAARAVPSTEDGGSAAGGGGRHTSRPLDVGQVVTAKPPKQPSAAQMPDRLAEADDWLSQYWPGREVAERDARAWHELRAAVFAHVAETDPDHHHEALALAGIEQRAAEGIAARDGVKKAEPQ